MFPFLDHVIAITPSPRQFAESLAVFLEPFYGNLYEALMEQLAKDPDIFNTPGDETGTVDFGKRWMRTLREQGESGMRRPLSSETRMGDAGGVRGVSRESVILWFYARLTCILSYLQGL
ncbi:hypothetical protein ACWERI_34495 [Streptomyces collinus]